VGTPLSRIKKKKKEKNVGEGTRNPCPKLRTRGKAKRVVLLEFEMKETDTMREKICNRMTIIQISEGEGKNEEEKGKTLSRKEGKYELNRVAGTLKYYEEQIS